VDIHIIVAVADIWSFLLLPPISFSMLLSNPKYRPRFYYRFRERWKETAKHHGVQGY
jgi:hypothetical protein